jgi:hypothetical protein
MIPETTASSLGGVCLHAEATRENGGQPQKQKRKGRTSQAKRTAHHATKISKSERETLSPFSSLETIYY